MKGANSQQTEKWIQSTDATTCLISMTGLKIIKNPSHFHHLVTCPRNFNTAFGQDYGLDVLAHRSRSSGVGDNLGFCCSRYLLVYSRLHLLHRKWQPVSLTYPFQNDEQIILWRLWDGLMESPTLLNKIMLENQLKETCCNMISYIISLFRSLKSLKKYVIAFCLGLLCAMPCLWAPACLLEKHMREKLTR